MKKFIYAFLTLASLAFVSCGDDDDSLPNIVPQDRGTVTDNEGNVYDWVRIGDRDVDHLKRPQRHSDDR